MQISIHHLTALFLFFIIQVHAEAATNSKTDAHSDNKGIEDEGGGTNGKEILTQKTQINLEEKPQRQGKDSGKEFVIIVDESMGDPTVATSRRLLLGEETGVKIAPQQDAVFRTSLKDKDLLSASESVKQVVWRLKNSYDADNITSRILKESNEAANSSIDDLGPRKRHSDLSNGFSELIERRVHPSHHHPRIRPEDMYNVDVRQKLLREYHLSQNAPLSNMIKYRLKKKPSIYTSKRPYSRADIGIPDIYDTVVEVNPIIKKQLPYKDPHYGSPPEVAHPHVPHVSPHVSPHAPPHHQSKPHAGPLHHKPHQSPHEYGSPPIGTNFISLEALNAATVTPESLYNAVTKDTHNRLEGYRPPVRPPGYHHKRVGTSEHHQKEEHHKSVKAPHKLGEHHYLDYRRPVSPKHWQIMNHLMHGYDPHLAQMKYGHNVHAKKDEKHIKSIKKPLGHSINPHAVTPPFQQYQPPLKEYLPPAPHGPSKNSPYMPPMSPLYKNMLHMLPPGMNKPIIGIRKKKPSRTYQKPTVGYKASKPESPQYEHKDIKTLYQIPKVKHPVTEVPTIFYTPHNKPKHRGTPKNSRINHLLNKHPGSGHDLGSHYITQSKYFYSPYNHHGKTSAIPNWLMSIGGGKTINPTPPPGYHTREEHKPSKKPTVHKEYIPPVYPHLSSVEKPPEKLYTPGDSISRVFLPPKKTYDAVSIHPSIKNSYGPPDLHHGIPTTPPQVYVPPKKPYIAPTSYQKHTTPHYGGHPHPTTPKYIQSKIKDVKQPALTYDLPKEHPKEYLPPKSPVLDYVPPKIPAQIYQLPKKTNDKHLAPHHGYSSTIAPLIVSPITSYLPPQSAGLGVLKGSYLPPPPPVIHNPLDSKDLPLNPTKPPSKHIHKTRISEIKYVSTTILPHHKDTGYNYHHSTPKPNYKEVISPLFVTPLPVYAPPTTPHSHYGYSSPKYGSTHRPIISTPKYIPPINPSKLYVTPNAHVPHKHQISHKPKTVTSYEKHNPTYSHPSIHMDKKHYDKSDNHHKTPIYNTTLKPTDYRPTVTAIYENSHSKPTPVPHGNYLPPKPYKQDLRVTTYKPPMKGWIYNLQDFSHPGGRKEVKKTPHQKYQVTPHPHVSAVTPKLPPAFSYPPHLAKELSPYDYYYYYDYSHLLDYNYDDFDYDSLPSLGLGHEHLLPQYFNIQENLIQDYGYIAGIPGRAGRDYPILSYIPKTTFACELVADYPGYYADMEAGCQVFHVCHSDGRQDSFLCPNGTVFNQKYFVCDWWYNFPCEDAPFFYPVNAVIGHPGVPLHKNSYERDLIHGGAYYNMMANAHPHKMISKPHPHNYHAMLMSKQYHTPIANDNIGVPLHQAMYYQPNQKIQSKKNYKRHSGNNRQSVFNYNNVKSSSKDINSFFLTDHRSLSLPGHKQPVFAGHDPYGYGIQLSLEPVDIIISSTPPFEGLPGPQGVQKPSQVPYIESTTASPHLTVTPHSLPTSIPPSETN